MSLWNMWLPCYKWPVCHVWLTLVIIHLTPVTPLNPPEYKLPDALNNVGYWMRL